MARLRLRNLALWHLADPIEIIAGDGMISIRTDPFPSNEQLNTLWEEAWGGSGQRDFGPTLSRSLAHLGAYDGERLVGFVNVATDGDLHAFILDTCVSPRLRMRGIATKLVREATVVAQERGAVWLHVDFEPHLSSLYRNCGFRPTEAGLIQLERPSASARTE